MQCGGKCNKTEGIALLWILQAQAVLWGRIVADTMYHTEKNLTVVCALNMEVRSQLNISIHVLLIAFSISAYDVDTYHMKSLTYAYLSLHAVYIMYNLLTLTHHKGEIYLYIYIYIYCIYVYIYIYI